MDSTQEVSGNDDVLANNVESSMGMPEGTGGETEESQQSEGNEGANDPLYVQKRLKQQKRAHEREMREMHARMAEMQAQMTPKQETYANTGYESAGNGGDINEAIHKAVSFALHHKENEERKMKDAEAQREIAKEYQDFQKHLDTTSDKYDDFDEVVRGHDSPFTATIRDAALVLPRTGAGSAGEVLYRLGQNPEELKRISRLLPHQQVAEVNKLSHALVSGGEKKESSSRPLGQIKSNPVVNSAGVTDKTPVSSIRERMKKGLFK
jgi:hypothetical protein